MNTRLLPLVLLTLGTALPAAESVPPEVAAIGILPDQRIGMRINADERNPFALKPKEIVKADEEDTETQESKIRAIFRQIQVTGVRRDRQGRFVALAGDLILRQGEEVQQVLEDQTEVLMVSKIEPQKIELTFVEDKDSTQPRVVVLPVRNQVQVTQKLFGQPKGKAGFYIARGAPAPELEETAAALAASPPTAPASARPADTAASGTTPAGVAGPRNPRADAAALAGLREQPRSTLTAERSAATTPPAPSASTPSGATTESGPPPTINRRRTAPPAAESPTRAGSQEVVE